MRLSQLSDKYDRDRLALSSVSTLRNKDRDAAPHLTGTSTSRLGQAAGAGRRAEGREASKRKPVESSDDWRRGECIVTVIRVLVGPLTSSP